MFSLMCVNLFTKKYYMTGGGRDGYFAGNRLQSEGLSVAFV